MNMTTGSSRSCRIAPWILACAVAAVLLTTSAAEATVCNGVVKEVRQWGTGMWEGAMSVTVQGSWGTSVWILCSVNADKGVAKLGSTPLNAVNEMHSATCEGFLTLALVAQSRGKNVSFVFDDTLDPAFGSCATIPNWGGVISSDPNEDDGRRLGAWDGFQNMNVQ